MKEAVPKQQNKNYLSKELVEWILNSSAAGGMEVKVKGC